MSNYYLIAFDPASTESAALHDVIKSSRTFSSWWHYLASAYLVKTSSGNLASVHEEIRRKWPNNRFLIIKVDPTFRDGWLPPDAWAWFKTRVD